MESSLFSSNFRVCFQVGQAVIVSRGECCEENFGLGCCVYDDKMEEEVLKVYVVES